VLEKHGETFHSEKGTGLDHLSVLDIGTGEEQPHHHLQ